MRFTLPTALLVIALSRSVIACGAPQLEANAQIPKIFIYEKGWAIPGLDGAAITRTYRDEAGATLTHYKPTKTVEIHVQGFELSADGRSLRLVPGYVQWVTDITEDRVQERIYGYQVVTVSLHRADPPMWPQVRVSVPPATPQKKKLKEMWGGVLGCGWTTIHYFDADGDGRFESLEYLGFGGPLSNSTECATTPEWALKLLPNRAAAESCKNRQQTLWRLPHWNLLNHEPVMPVLAQPPDNQSDSQ